MKTANLNLPGEFSHAKVRGHIGRRAGTPGPTIYDAGGNEVTSSDITILGAGVSGDTEMAYITIRGTGDQRTNDAGDSLTYGDVVVLQDDGTVTTTTTPQDTRPVGVVQVGGGDGQPVIVVFAGFVSRVNCTASVTAGYYGETSSTAGSATDNATVRTGSFCQFLESSATPAAYLFGSSSPGSGSDDFLLKYEGGQDAIKAHGSMGSTETIDPTDGNVHTGTLNADCTITLGAPSGSGACTLELWITEDSTGGWDITWPGSVTEQGTHDTAMSTTQRVILESIDGGTSWIATWIGASAATTRWELAVISGSPPDPLYADGDYLYIEVPV